MNGDEMAPRDRIEALVLQVQRQTAEALRGLVDPIAESVERACSDAAASARAEAEAAAARHLEDAVSGVRAEVDAHLQQVLGAARSEADAQLRQAVAAARADADRALRDALVAANAQAEAQLRDTLAAANADAQARLEQAVAAANALADVRLQQAVANANAQAESRLREAVAAAHTQAESSLIDALAAAHSKDVEARERSLADARASEREAELAASERVLDALRELDRGRTLGEVLDVLALTAARETARALVLIARGNRLRGRRAAGFPADFDAKTIDLDITEGGIIARAIQDGQRAATSDGGTLRAPAFIGLPADRVGLALPLNVGGQIVGVLYADDVSAGPHAAPTAWPETLEILTRHAARCLEALTVQRAAAATAAAEPPARVTPTTPTPGGAGDEPSPEEAARRYARLLVSEIKMYHQPSVEEGRRSRDLMTRLAPEIDRARRLYEERVRPDVRARGDFFEQELVRTLADGDASLIRQSTT